MPTEIKETALLEPAVVGTLLNGSKAIIEELVLNVGLRPEDFYDSKCRKAYELIIECYREDIVPNPAAVFAKSKRRLEHKWLQEIAHENNLLLEDAVSRSHLIIEQSEERELSKVLVSGIVSLEQENRNVHSVRDGLMEQLSRTRGIRQLEGAMASIHSHIDGSSQVIHMTPTGLKWLDGWLRGGLRSNRFYAIAGPQGGRKSTWARNIILGAVRDKNKRPRENVSVALLAFENDREISYFDFVSMLSIEWLAEQGEHKRTFPSNDGGEPIPITEWLDAESIQARYRQGKVNQLHPLIRQAIQVGMDRADRLPLAIYDSGEETGNLVDRNAMDRCILAHRYKYVGEDTHYIIVVDYAQLVSQDGNLFEDMQALARDALRTTARLNCTFILLSQFNEDTNLMQAQGQKDYVRLKGGGDIRAGVQNLMLVEYDSKNHPDKLVVKSGKARRGKGSAAYTFHIDPVSGLVLP